MLTAACTFYCLHAQMQLLREVQAGTSEKKYTASHTNYHFVEAAASLALGSCSDLSLFPCVLVAQLCLLKSQTFDSLGAETKTGIWKQRTHPYMGALPVPCWWRPPSDRKLCVRLSDWKKEKKKIKKMKTQNSTMAVTPEDLHLSNYIFDTTKCWWIWAQRLKKCMQQHMFVWYQLICSCTSFIIRLTYEIK